MAEKPLSSQCVHPEQTGSSASLMRRQADDLPNFDFAEARGILMTAWERELPTELQRIIMGTGDYDRQDEGQTDSEFIFALRLVDELNGLV